MRQARDLYVKRDVPAFLQKGVEPPSPVMASRKTLPRRRRAGDLELRVPGEEAPARTDDVLGRPKTSRVGVGLARTRRKAAKPERRIPKRGASAAEKDDEKGASHAQNGVAETGRGPANATSREPA